MLIRLKYYYMETHERTKAFDEPFIRCKTRAAFVRSGKEAKIYLEGGKMDRRFNLLRAAVPAIKYFPDNWGTRSGVDRRKKNGTYGGPERRIRTERRCGMDRRKLSFIQRRAVFDLREAYRDL